MQKTYQDYVGYNYDTGLYWKLHASFPPVGWDSLFMIPNEPGDWSVD